MQRELLQGQKMLGWVLMLMGLSLLIMIGLAQSLEARTSFAVLEIVAAWNATLGAAVASLLMAGGYAFVLSVSVEERLRHIGAELEERINRLTRELAGVQQRIGDRSGTGDPAGNRGARGDPSLTALPTQRAEENGVGASAGVGTAPAKQ